MTVYTLGHWHVREGREQEFAAKWRELTELSVAEIEPDARVILLRDRVNHLQFRSIGEFRNEEAIIKWRDGSVLAERLGDLADMLEHAESGLFEVVDSINLHGLR